MKINWQRCLIIAVPVLLTGAPVLADDDGWNKGARESVEISDHVIFGTTDIVDGATVLIRDFKKKQVDATISTSALEPDYAYSIWWAVFNRPQYCATPYRCAGSDLEVNGGDPRIRASVFWAGGFVADDSGTANVSLSLNPGRTTRQLFGMTKDYGLRNLRKAEIHVVLRTHGIAGLAGPVSKQIGTADEACPEPDCANVFASFHPPRD